MSEELKGTEELETTPPEGTLPPEAEGQEESSEGGDSGLQPPIGFSAEQWTGLPEAVKQSVAKREQERERHFTKRTQEIAALEKDLMDKVGKLGIGLEKFAEKMPSEKPTKPRTLKELGPEMNDPEKFQAWLEELLEQKLTPAMERKIGEFAQAQERRNQETEAAKYSQEWGNFCKAHPDAPSLVDHMTYLVAVGKNLSEAYEEAKTYSAFRKSKAKPAVETPGGGIPPRGDGKGVKQAKTVQEAFEMAKQKFKEEGIDIDNLKPT